jgi:uncharacterized protein (DUF1501 family)
MLHHDHSTAEALALLSRGDDDPSGIDRRQFLKLVGMGVAAGSILGAPGAALLGGIDPDRAWAANPIGPTDGILVLVGMNGGLDNLNTVVPYSDGRYYDYRRGVSIAPGQVLPLDGQLGLHPRLPYLKALYDLGMVAVVQGVGNPVPDFSHFSSMATWMSARPGGVQTSGWIGRWLDGLGESPDVFRAANVGTTLPLHLVGDSRRGTVVPEWGMQFGSGVDPNETRLYNAFRSTGSAAAGRGELHDRFAHLHKGHVDLAADARSVFARPLPSGPLVKKMNVAARLINANIGFRVLDCNYTDFDSHSGLPGSLNNLLGEFDAALSTFYAELAPEYRSRVVIMTYSEFGRTPWGNASAGTDHGSSNNMFVIGDGVQGGLYGQQPSLANLNRWDRLEVPLDFRSLYASMLDGWLGGGSRTVLGGTFPDLGLFKIAPGGGLPLPSTGTAPSPGAPGEFVGVVPARVLDTRDGTGSPVRRLGGSATRNITVLGVGGVPASGVTAVVLNMTAVSGTSASYLSVYPAGESRPGTSSLNCQAGTVVPNLVTCKVGENGQVSVYNRIGTIDVVADVVGYFRSAAAGRLNAQRPARILDTRDGTGWAGGALPPDGQIDLAIIGAGGVPAGATAVVLNVTATQPTAPGYLTVFPSGAGRPTASNLNFGPGDTVPNLVMCQIGSNGHVSIFNAFGATHVIADVLGYYHPSSGQRMVPISPARLMDSRTDGGGPNPLNQAARPLAVLGRGGVPAGGVTAVALNVTVTQPTNDTYLTVYPTGDVPPLASNLNVMAGQTRANMVIGALGGDGTISLFNAIGQAHAIVDVVGYFTS